MIRVSEKVRTCPAFFISAAGIVIAAALGLAVSGRVRPLGFELPRAVLLGALFLLLILPILLARWRVSLGLFLVVLVVEDLIRKLAGNDIRVYFLKDLMFFVLIAAMALSREAHGAWRQATGRARVFLYLLVAWAVAMSVPTGLQDWRVPVVGIRLYFMYLPLAAAGYILARDAKSLRNPLGWMIVLGGAATAIGIAQGVIGPSFLAPGRPTPGLSHLVLVRGNLDSGEVFRPTGTFVDPGRFLSMTLVALALALAVLVTEKLKPVWAIALLPGGDARGR